MPKAIRTTYGHAQERRRSDGAEGGSKISVSRLGDDEGQATAADSSASVATIGWMPKRDEAAVDDADERAADERDRDRDGRAVAEVQRQQRGGDRHHRSDREVDAPRADDERHARAR